MASEPEIITHNRDQLTYLLTEAAEIEHGLMCCYLYAAYSLRRGASDELAADEAAAVERWRSTIVGVALEEMLHLALANNLLVAIGSPPHFQRPNFPVAPGYHPAGVVVSLAPFDRATLDHFIYLERPEGVEVPDGEGFDPPPPYERVIRPDRLVPSSQDYETVGHLYRGIRHGFESLAADLGPTRLFVGSHSAQLDLSSTPLAGLIAVTDLPSALRAIDTIVEQGEGSPSNPETSHFRRFVAVRDEYRALLRERPEFQPSLPVARNPVMRQPPLPQGKVHINHPDSARVMDLANAVYAFALRCLGRAFGEAEDSPTERCALIDSSLEAMRLFSSVAETLCRLPASASHPGMSAGVSFTMQRSTVGFSERHVAWSLLAERAQEISRRCREIANDIDPSLAEVGERLEAVAARLARSERRTPLPSQVASRNGSTVEKAATNASAIEEARGENILLRFEGKRCIHARFCVLGAPNVFLANVKGPWLHPDAMPVEELVATARACPSGAITYERLDGGPPKVRRR